MDMLGNNKDGLGDAINSPLGPVLNGLSPEAELILHFLQGGVAQNLGLVDGKGFVKKLDLPVLGLGLLALS